MIAPAADAEARRRAVDAPHSVLVQAPAGSGKTTLLVQRYLRLLATVDGPERILALTFTRRAAQEMRVRVLDALEAAAADRCPQGFNARTFELAAQARGRLQAQGVLLHPSRLRIETIDSFNGWLAAQLPVTAGAGARLALVENAAALYEEAARRALAYRGKDQFGESLERVLELGDQRWKQIRKLLVDMLPSRDRWLPLLAGSLGAAGRIDGARLAAVRARFDADLELLVVRALREAESLIGREALDELGGCIRAAALRDGGERAELAVFASSTAPLVATAEDLVRWRTLARLLLTQDPRGKLRATVTSKEGFPPGCAEKPILIDLLERFARTPGVARALATVRALPDCRYADEDWDRVREVAHLFVLACAELDGVFREHGAVDFPAVSIAALRALGTAEAPTDLALRLDYRVQHLLLDEFQDTSAAQLELVRILTAGWERGDGRSVFCVGDPMQSIYGFRQAEVRAFLELADEGLGAMRFDLERLSSNFRSAPALVDWVNRCFVEVLPRSDDRVRGAIAFRPSRSQVDARGQVDDQGQDASQVRCAGYASRAAEARAAAELILNCRARHPSWRIAVLVRARSHARAIAHGLREYGIAFRAVDLELLQDRAAVRDLVMLVCALLHHCDRPAWLALLRSPWVGLELADLLVIARARPIVWEALCDVAALEQLSAPGRVRCARLRAVLELAFETRSHATLDRWVEQTWIALGGPACAAEERDLEHVRAVFVRLRKLDEEGMPDAAELAAAFSDLYAEGDPAAAVEIMTIHKSKGLEFDCVIVPALERHARSAQAQLLLMHPFSRTRRAGLAIAARPPIGSRSALFDFLRRLQRDNENLESERLLYVACTRAKYQLHLSATVGSALDPDAAPGEESDEDALRAAKPATRHRPPHAGSLLAVLGRVKHLEDAFVPPDSAPLEELEEEAELAGLRGGPLIRAPAGWSPRPIVPAPFEPLVSNALPREETPVFDWAGETARRIGVLVHAELQRLDPARSVADSVHARRPHFERWLASQGVPHERLAQAGERIVAALVAVHQDPRARWILSGGYRDDLREHALSGVWRGEVVRAVFDRSFIDDSGVRWVIDYKTSQHVGGGREEFLDREVVRYRAQLERYAALAARLGPERVRVGLYFPMMGAWREWDP